MTNDEVLSIALTQSAIDCNCAPEDFLAKENKVCLTKTSSNARRYLELPFLCYLVSYGNNVVASVSEDYFDIAAQYINRFPPEHCFETPNLHVLMDRVKRLSADVCDMSEYWLPDVTENSVSSCSFETRLLVQADFEKLYLPEWSNALGEKRKNLDILGVGAYDGEKLVGLAGCSKDCESMWQIGVDVLPEYRRMGIASTLTGRLKNEVLKRGFAPFYCCAWSNVKSARNAFRSGFKPAWVELTVKKRSLIDSINGNEEK